MRTKIIPYCHPDKPHHARGLCKNCYEKKYIKWHTIIAQKKRDNAKEFRLKCLREWYIILKRLNKHKCSKCGYDNNFSVIDFHHKGGKIFKIGKLFQRKPTKLIIWTFLNEDTIPLCSNCHRELHHPNLNKENILISRKQ